MKALNVIAKVVVALAAVAGAVYLAATYGDKIVAWAKKTLGCCKDCECEETVEETPVEEIPEEVPAEEETAEEAPAEEVSVSEDEVVATEADFAEE